MSFNTHYNSDKLCSSCRTRYKPSDGDYIVFNKGLNRRWCCTRCLDARKARNKELATRAE